VPCLARPMPDTTTPSLPRTPCHGPACPPEPTRADPRLPMRARPGRPAPRPAIPDPPCQGCQADPFRPSRYLPTPSTPRQPCLGPARPASPFRAISPSRPNRSRHAMSSPAVPSQGYPLQDCLALPRPAKPCLPRAIRSKTASPCLGPPSLADPRPTSHARQGSPTPATECHAEPRPAEPSVPGHAPHALA
jgi:hypothetical protein